MRYTVRPTDSDVTALGDWNSPAWETAEVLTVANFRPESSEHRPVTHARFLHTPAGVAGAFHVQDRYVRCVQTDYQASVCGDSCVEFFCQPKPGAGYLNFEFNCGGGLLCSHVRDETRTPNGFKDFSPLPWRDGRQVAIRHSLPATVDPEIVAPTEWWLTFFVPFTVFEPHVGALGSMAGQEWRVNVYKCGDRTSHPHWAAWAPVDVLNFHLPRCFGTFEFA